MPIKIVSHKDLTWYDISQPTRHDIDWLEENFSFHPLDFEDVVSRLQRPKLDEYDDYLFMVLHFPVFDKQQQVTQPAEIDIFVGEGFLITIHVSKIWPLERFFEACEGSEKVRQDDMGLGAGHLLYRVMDKLVDNFFPIAYKIERNVQEIEDEIFELSGRETVEKISLLRRDIIAYRRIVKPLIPVISRLEYVKSRLISEELELYFSDIGDALARLWDMLEDQKGIIESLNDTYNSLTTHRTNEVIRALTVISVIMLPLTLLSGIYGMNVHLPISDWPFAFEAVLGMMVLLATLMVSYFRHKKWI